EDPLSSISIEEFNNEFAVNATSALFAAQEAVPGFKQLPRSEAKTFIETGNKLNVIALPNVLAFGMGKSATAHMIQCASIAYKQHGFKYASAFGSELLHFEAKALEARTNF